jgi:hypothetical protein
MHHDIEKKLEPLTLQQSQVPTFDAWKSSLRIELHPDSPRSLQQLYRDIFVSQEVSLVEDAGRVTRFGKVACIDVYFSAEDVRYKLQEERNKLRPGKSFQDVLSGDPDALEPSAPRPAWNSLSERMKLDGETPVDAAVRALHEELFTSGNVVVSDTVPQLGATLRSHLKPAVEFTKRVERAADAPGNSYRGIPSVLVQYNFEITFVAGMQVPIKVIDGVPQPLYEHVTGKPYVNIFRWQKC